MLRRVQQNHLLMIPPGLRTKRQPEPPCPWTVPGNCIKFHRSTSSWNFSREPGGRTYLPTQSSSEPKTRQASGELSSESSAWRLPCLARSMRERRLQQRCSPTEEHTTNHVRTLSEHSSVKSHKNARSITGDQQIKTGWGHTAHKHSRKDGDLGWENTVAGHVLEGGRAEWTICEVKDKF